nr:MAG TPA_asm: hypothetical protein [Caudoviricetes sp.]
MSEYGAQLTRAAVAEKWDVDHKTFAMTAIIGPSMAR